MLLDLLKSVVEWAWRAFVGRRSVRLLVHQAFFMATDKASYFLNITNLSRDRELEITHVWFDLDPQVHAMTSDRPLPKRLKPEETWETWVEAERLPAGLGEKVFTLGRARLSGGRIVKSSKNKNMASAGFVPGGPIQTIANEYQAGHILLESQSNDSPNNDAPTYAFISYNIEDKHVARRIKEILAKIGMESFLAHEDIEVSDEWRLRILSEIGRANLFIPLLSENFYNSTWCIQELGIASFRKEMTVIPLSIDENIPQGFSLNIQSTRIDPESFTLTDLLPGIAKHDVALAIDIMIEIIASSRSFRRAEANFRLILPYLNQASDDQIKLLLEKVADNGQVHQAAQCANEYIPPLLESHGHLLDNDTRSSLTEKLGKN